MGFDDKVEWMSEKSEIFRNAFVDGTSRLAEWLTSGKEKTFEMLIGPGPSE
jgi:hypothetical protein